MSNKKVSVAFPRISVGDLRALYVPDTPAKELHDKMVRLVDNMLALFQRQLTAKIPDDQTRLQREITATDRQIDALVYQLYGLTADEIALVEKTTS